MIMSSIALLALALLLTGCSWFAAGAPQANFTIQSASYLNPDIQNNPEPIVVTVYQLKNQFAFKQASYDALANNSAAVLGNDLIDKDIMEVRPGKTLEIAKALSPDTQYIGIVAAYRDINKARWHSLLKVPEPGKNANIRLSLESEGVSASISKASRF